MPFPAICAIAISIWTMAPVRPDDAPPVYRKKIETAISGVFEVKDGTSVSLPIGDLEADNFRCAIRVRLACGVAYNANTWAEDALQYQKCLAERDFTATVTIRSGEHVVRRTTAKIIHPELDDIDPRTESMLVLTFLNNQFVHQFQGGNMNEGIGPAQDVTVDLSFSMNDKRPESVQLQFVMIASDPESHGP